MKATPYSDAELNLALAHARSAATSFATNFYIISAERPDWFRRGICWFTPRDAAVVVFGRMEGDLGRLYFAGENILLTETMAAVARENSGTLVVDLIGRATELALVATSLVQAGFQYHERLLRLAHPGAGYLAGPPAMSGDIQKADASAILAMIRAYFDPLADQFPELDDVAGAIARNEILAICKDQGLAGFVWFKRKGATATISYLSVNSAFRGQGLASVLMDGYLARTIGVHRHLIWVREQNEKAVACYAHYGYKADGLENHVYVRKRKS